MQSCFCARSRKVTLAKARKALLIGCNYPGQAEELESCVGDCLKVRGWLQGFGYECTLLRDDQPDKSLEGFGTRTNCCTRSFGSRPTRTNIIAALKALIAWANEEPGREIWVHYSGHGVGVQDREGDESDGQDEALVPTDFSTKGVIVDDVLTQMVSELRCNASAMFVFDCCHSGSMIDLPFVLDYKTKLAALFGMLWTTGGSAVGKGIDKRSADERLRSASAAVDANVYVLSGCQDPQVSVETMYNGGALTAALLKVMQPDDTPRGLLSKLHRHLILTGGYIQIPEFSSSKSIKTMIPLPFLSRPTEGKQRVAMLEEM